MIRFLSVCSGIEAASQALHHHGFQCAAVSEIEPQPCTVLAHRFGASRPVNMPDPEKVPTHEADGTPRKPAAIRKDRTARANAIKAVAKLPSEGDIPNFGDMSRFQEWPDADFDALFGGTPCQSFSVAGLRAGLADPRGNLMLTFGAIAARFRPRWVGWENVPGVLSSNDGRDFASLLGLLSGRSIAVPEGGWQNSGIVPGIADAYGLAWCVLDAQYVRTSRFRKAVPQRRRRVFVVGYSGDWRRAAAVLFDAESLRGDPPPRREAGKGTSASVAPSLTGSGRGVERTGETRGQDPVIAISTKDHPDPANRHLLDVPELRGNVPSLHRGGDGLRNLRTRHDGGVIAAEVTTSLDASMGRLQGTSGQDANHGHSTLVAYGSNNTSGPIEVAAALLHHESPRQDFESDTFLVQPVAPTLRGEGFDATDDGTGKGTPIIPVAYGIRSDATRDGDAKTPSADAEGRIRLRRPGMGITEGVAPTLDAGIPHAVAFNSREDPEVTGDRAGPLGSSLPQAQAIAYGFQPRIARNGRGDMGEVAAALNAESGQTGKGDAAPHVAIATPAAWAVRRLTPVECERLMGMDDGFTDVPWRGKAFSPDGNRYKELGNSWALNAIDWIGERIAIVDTWD